MRFLVGLCMALTGLLPGCGKDVTVPALTAGDLPRLEAAANFPHRGYTIEAGDAVQVRYTFHPELNQEVIVQPDGKVTLLQLGDVEAAGRTPRALEAALVELLLARGADPIEAEAEPWARPLAWAERRHHAGIASLIRERGAVR